MIESEALLHYSVPNATLYDPSPFKTFTVGMGSPFSGVRSYQAPNGLWEGHLIDWSRDIKQTSATRDAPAQHQLIQRASRPARVLLQPRRATWK